MPDIQVLQIIATAHGFGGGSRHVYDLVTQLKVHGIHSTVVAPQGRENLLLEMLEAAKIPTVVQAMPSAFDKQAIKALQDILQRWAQDHAESQRLIHIHGFRAGILARRALGALARELAIPIIYTEHLLTLDYRLPNPIRQQLQYWYLRQADKVTTKTIAVSEAVRTFLLAKKITTPDKIAVIPNGVAVRQIENSKSKIEDEGQRAKGKGQTVDNDPAAAANKLQAIPPERDPAMAVASYKLGMLGSLVPLKRHEDVIRALPLVNQNLTGVTLHIVGDGPLKAELEQLAKKLGVAKQIVWHGHLDEPRPVVASWDILISASTSESFGLGIAEAMSEGVPVIATRVGAVPELVTKETGRLVPVHEPHEMAKAIIDLLPRTELRQHMGQTARERIDKNYTVEIMAERVAKLYEEVVSL